MKDKILDFADDIINHRKVDGELEDAGKIENFSIFHAGIII